MAKAKRAKKEIVIPDHTKTREEVPRDIVRLTENGCTEFENYQVQAIHRSQVKDAPYNPRQITTEARKKLKENFKKRGLMGPPIWNRRTGNLVGGHQRVSILDALEGTNDYKLRVAVVDIDEVTEREQNVFLNNPEAQGFYDIDKLGEMFKFEGMEVEATGFDYGTLYQIFGDSPIIQQPEQLERLATHMKTVEGAMKMIDTKRDERSDVDFYCVVVFKSADVRGEFLEKLGLPDNRYVDGRKLLSLLEENKA